MPIRELSRRTGISPDLLRKWERRYGLTDPERTSGGHRLYSRVDEARIRLMLDGVSRGMRPAQAAEHALGARLALRGQPAAPGAADQAVDRRQAIARALADYDEGRADTAVEPLEARLSPVALVRDVYWPLIAEAERAAGDPLRPLTLAWVTRRLGRLCDGWGRGAGPRALLAADESASATPWILCFGISLRAFGWRVTALGPGLSAPALRRAAGRLRPRNVVLAAPDAASADSVLAELGLGPGRGRVAVPGSSPPDGENDDRSGSGRLDPDPVAAATGLAV